MFFLLLIAKALSYCKETMRYTECNQDLERDLIITNNCGNDYKVYRQLDCTYECSKDQFIKISGSGQQSCEKCPKGTFSTGGSTVYGRHGKKWTASTHNFNNECWIFTDSYNYRNDNCTGWTFHDDFLISGSTHLPLTFTSGLILTASIVKQGSLTIKYRKFSTKFEGSSIGFFSVFLDLFQIYFDDEIDGNVWKTVTLPLEVGIHEIYIEYMGKNTEEMPHPTASISSIEIYGSEYASTTCEECSMASSLIDTISCNDCDFNQYLKEGMCEDCPSGTFSHKGATDISYCLPMVPCSSSDLTRVYSKCKDGQRGISYMLKDPILCDTSNYNIPMETSSAPCGKCDPGYVNDKDEEGYEVCKACEKGEYADNDTQNQCKKCPAGTHAWNVAWFKEWIERDLNYTTYCLQADGTRCFDSTGWTAETFSLTSGKNFTSSCELVLEIRVYIEAPKGLITTHYTLNNYNQGVFNIIVDGNWIYSNNDQLSQVSAFSITSGWHLIQWVYIPLSGSSEEARINEIKIEGGVEGSASQCYKCATGFVSQAGQSVCKACDAGYTSNPSNTECVACNNFYYSSSSGSPCTLCPPGTLSNSDKTGCVGSEFAYFNGSTYFLGNLTGRKLTNTGALEGICELSTVNPYCIQTFYGPLPSEASSYYISVLNPSIIDLPDVSVDSSTPSFAYKIFEHKSQKTQCGKFYSAVSLGTTALSVDEISDGLAIVYSNGDVCNKQGKRFNSLISLVCDKNSGVGWPTFEGNEECEYRFVWKSKYGCRVCRSYEMVTVLGECLDGKRTVKRLEGAECILPFRTSIEYSESCSALEEILNSWPMFMTFLLLIGLLFIGVFSSALCYKYHRGYKLLKNPTDSSNSN